MTVKKSKRGLKNERNGRKLSLEQRMEMISTAAYFLAEKRGFKNGSAEQDWLLAESQINELFVIED